MKLIGKPSINGPFSMAMLNNQRVYWTHRCDFWSGERQLNCSTLKHILVWCSEFKGAVDGGNFTAGVQRRCTEVDRMSCLSSTNPPFSKFPADRHQHSENILRISFILIAQHCGSSHPKRFDHGPKMRCDDDLGQHADWTLLTLSLVRSYHFNPKGWNRSRSSCSSFELC